MIITNHGKQSFKLQTGDTIIALNPISKKSKAKASNFGADVTMVTTEHPDYNGAENTSYGDKEPFVINGPGSYEIAGTHIDGALSWADIGKDKLVNTLYAFTFDGIRVCFLGALTNKEISEQAREVIDGADVVFVSLGKDTGLSPTDAYKVASSFSPGIIVPMEYDSASLKTFTKEAGGNGEKPVEKLTIKAKDLHGKEGEVVALGP